MAEYKRHKSINHEDINPCTKEQQQSYKCLNDNHYDNEKCFLQFENYKKCKEFWSAVTFKRRSLGISPNLPLAPEREKIKEKYLKTGILEVN